MKLVLIILTVGLLMAQQSVVSINGIANQGAVVTTLKLNSVVSVGSVPGISGCSAGTQLGGATVGSYVSGTSGTCTVTLTFALTAPNGWFCRANDLTTSADVQSQTATTATTAIIAGTTVSGDVINFGCMAY